MDKEITIEEFKNELLKYHKSDLIDKVKAYIKKADVNNRSLLTDEAYDRFLDDKISVNSHTNEVELKNASIYSDVLRELLKEFEVDLICGTASIYRSQRDTAIDCCFEEMLKQPDLYYALSLLNPGEIVDRDESQSNLVDRVIESKKEVTIYCITEVYDLSWKD